MKILSLNKLSLVREVLILCIIVYFSQGVFFAKGTIISQFALLLILSISFYYFLKIILLQKNKNIFIWAWTSLFLVNILGFFFTLELRDPIFISQVKAIALFFLPFFPFYYLSKKDKIHEKTLLRFFILMLIVTILSFNYREETILANRISDSANVVNNIAYDFVLLIPYVFLIKKRILSIVSMFILLVFIIQGAKRGALVVGFVGALFFIYHQLVVVDTKNKIKGYFLAFTGMVLSVFYLYSYFLTNEYLITRLLEVDEGGSGRNVIFSSLLKAWYNSDNFVNYIFGYGFASTLHLSTTGNFAHNDWLELLTNFGLIGIFLYVLVFYGLLKEVFEERKANDYRVILLAIISMWLVKTLFSMVYTANSSIIMTLLLAFLIGKKIK